MPRTTPTHFVIRSRIISCHNTAYRRGASNRWTFADTTPGIMKVGDKKKRQMLEVGIRGNKKNFSHDKQSIQQNHFLLLLVVFQQCPSIVETKGSDAKWSGYTREETLPHPLPARTHTWTHTEIWNTYSFSTAMMVTSTRLNDTLYVHCLFCCNSDAVCLLRGTNLILKHSGWC